MQLYLREGSPLVRFWTNGECKVKLQYDPKCNSQTPEKISDPKDYY